MAMTCRAGCCNPTAPVVARQPNNSNPTWLLQPNNVWRGALALPSCCSHVSFLWTLPPDYKFELAVSLGRLELALQLAGSTESEVKWRQVRTGRCRSPTIAGQQPTVCLSEEARLLQMLACCLATF